MNGNGQLTGPLVPHIFQIHCCKRYRFSMFFPSQQTEPFIIHSTKNAASTEHMSVRNMGIWDMNHAIPFRPDLFFMVGPTSPVQQGREQTFQATTPLLPPWLQSSPRWLARSALTCVALASASWPAGANELKTQVTRQSYSSKPGHWDIDIVNCKPNYEWLTEEFMQYLNTLPKRRLVHGNFYPLLVYIPIEIFVSMFSSAGFLPSLICNSRSIRSRFEFIFFDFVQVGQVIPPMKNACQLQMVCYGSCSGKVLNQYTCRMYRPFLVFSPCSTAIIA